VYSHLLARKSLILGVCVHYFYKNEKSDENIIDDWNIDRTDSALVKVVETLGEKTGDGKYCIFKVVEIPDDVKWYIANHHQGEGENIVEEHRTWK
jgi:hypothetical protein